MITTDRERAIVEIVRYNDANPIEGVRRGVRVGRLTLGFEWRSRRNLWGRFGGGWNWALGFMASRRTLVVRLLVCSVRVSIGDRAP